MLCITIYLLILKQLKLHDTTAVMESTIHDYLSVLKLKVPVKYVHMTGSPTNGRGHEIVIDTTVLDTCPSVRDLSRAIEKRVNRSDTMRSESNVVPLCMVLLCSKAYCINSKAIEGVSDTLVERCWECLETVSHSTAETLQEWLSYAIGTRGAVAYAMLFCEHKSSSIVTRNIPTPLFKSMRFVSIDPKSIDIPTEVWHREDAVNRTMLAHMSAAMLNISDKSKRVDEK